MSGPRTDRWPLQLDEAMSAVAWSADGSTLWAASADGMVVHATPSGDQVWHQRHTTRVVELAVDPTTDTLASADAHGRVVLGDTGYEGPDLALGSRVRSLTWSPVGSLLAATSQAAGVVVIDLRGSRVGAVTASRRLRRATWHLDGPAPLAVVGAGGITWIDPTAPEPVVSIDRMPGAGLTVTSTTGGWLAVGGLRGEVRVANTGTGQQWQIRGWPDPVSQLALLPGGSHVVVAGGDELTSWPLRTPEEDAANEDDVAETTDTGPEPARYVPDGTGIAALAPHPWRSVVAVGTRDGAVAIWDPVAGSTDRYRLGTDPVTTLAWNGLGDQLAIGTRGGALHLWAPVG